MEKVKDKRTTNNEKKKKKLTSVKKIIKRKEFFLNWSYKRDKTRWILMNNFVHCFKSSREKKKNEIEVWVLLLKFSSQTLISPLCCWNKDIGIVGVKGEWENWIQLMENYIMDVDKKGNCHFQVNALESRAIMLWPIVDKWQCCVVNVESIGIVLF